MGDKKRWSDPANEGQVDYVKVGIRMFALIMLLALAAVIKIAIANNWLESFSQNARILGF
ncbi:hypothetical protein KKB43_03980 [Patescibacteria group bacterium]|nr:hypothetical protein [Patescibacteria group bacterium]MBU4141813.1 hypothetical protein [Patescibacteria group bacterium]MBU4338933.1 hypothetical protein [Patescibacteria group bacterium]MBU4580149.1 hypothetical protein [Patescibacteria group bacterium]